MLCEESGESDADGENGTLIYIYEFSFFFSFGYGEENGRYPSSSRGESGSEKMRGRISRGF